MHTMTDFTIDCRPRRFCEVWGNAEIKRIMQVWLAKDILRSLSF